MEFPELNCQNSLVDMVLCEGAWARVIDPCFRLTETSP